MRNGDPNVLVLELAAKELEPLLDDLTLVGGCAVGLLVSDPSRPPVRPTVDVDVLTEVVTIANYYQMAERIKHLGFVEGEHPICRFIKKGLVIDLMPTSEEILGFGNRWYPGAVDRALFTDLPSGRRLRHIAGPYMLATKLEAFHGRADGDYMHHDMEDIINLVDGRPELVGEIAAEPEALREYLREEFDELLGDAAFLAAVPAHFHPTEDHASRLPVVLERLRRVAGL